MTVNFWPSLFLDIFWTIVIYQKNWKLSRWITLVKVSKTSNHDIGGAIQISCDCIIDCNKNLFISKILIIWMLFRCCWMLFMCCWMLFRCSSSGCRRSRGASSRSSSSCGGTCCTSGGSTSRASCGTGSCTRCQHTLLNIAIADFRSRITVIDNTPWFRTFTSWVAAEIMMTTVNWHERSLTPFFTRTDTESWMWCSLTHVTNIVDSFWTRFKTVASGSITILTWWLRCTSRGGPSCWCFSYGRGCCCGGGRSRCSCGRGSGGRMLFGLGHDKFSSHNSFISRFLLRWTCYF